MGYLYVMRDKTEERIEEETEERIEELGEKLKELVKTIKCIIDIYPELEEELRPYLSELSELRKLLRVRNIAWLGWEEEKILEEIAKKLEEIDKALGKYRYLL